MKAISFEEDKNEQIENDEKINIKEYSDLIGVFYFNFKQEDIDILNDDKKKILNYFYLRESKIETYINNKYKNNDNKRHLNIRLADYLLRVQFRENESICKTTKLINDLILQVNESYNEQNNLNDLSDETYLNKVKKVLGVNKVPKFLLRAGYRLIRQIQKNKEFILESIIKVNENKNDKEYNNNHYSDKENAYSTDEQSEQSEQYSIKNISKEIENKQKLPFDRELSEIYLMIFLLSLKEDGNEEIYKTIKKNLTEFIKYFNIKTELKYDEFKKKYIDFNDKELPINIVEMEFLKLNESEYLCKYILASYYALIKKIFRSKIDIYINLLLYLQKYIKQENGLLGKIIENEINSAFLSNSKDDKHKNKYKINLKFLKNFVKNSKKNTHEAKSFDYSTIKNTFDCSNDSKLKERFYEVIKEEESYEIGSNSFFLNVIKLFEPLYKLKKSTQENTIKNHLKLIPYQKNIKGRNILILISGYLSSNGEHSKEWNKLIEVYIKKYKNPIIYFFNWPSSEFQLIKILYHWKDFKDARERGKYCGRLLALMMMSNSFFKEVEINIAAFSLGNHVLKHCIKELENFGRLDILNNIIFMAGATNIECNFKWEQRLSSIKGAIINCYSDIDLALAYCKLITGKDTIGTKKLKFKNKNVINYLISSFHVLYRINMDIIGQILIDDLKN